MEVISKLISELTPYENNPRINDSAIDAVMESIRSIGYVAPIIIDEDGVILAGHTRFEAVKKLNFKAVDCVLVSGLTDQQKRKYRILDNRLAESATWDFEKLKEELKDLDYNKDWFDLTDEIVEVLKNDEPMIEDNAEVRCPRCGALILNDDPFEV